MDATATRRERVVLELEDHFTKEMLRAAAAAKLLDKELNSLSGSSVSAARDNDKVAKSVKGVGDEVDKTSKKTRDATRDIDRYSGRLRLLTEAAVTIGPAMVPIGAVAIPATVALAGALGAAAGAAGVAVLAFNGVGDALGALNDYQLEQTTANLEKMRAEMDALGPSGASFVTFLDSLEPEFRALQQTARAGLFPGVEAGLTSMLELMPQVRLIVFNLATEMGRLSAEAGGALSGPGFAAFFDYLETDAAPTLAAFGHAIGNVAEGLGSLMVAFAPLSRGFAAGMEEMTQSFADWAAGLSQTDGFRSFVAYVRESGPQVLALLGSLATAFVDIAVAAAPVGAAVLPALTALARILSVIAGSPIGPPLFTAAAAMLALSRATTVANAAMVRFSSSTAAGVANVGKLKGALSFAAILAGIWAVDAALDEVFGDRSVDGDNLLQNLNNLKTSDAAAELDKIGVSIRNINSAAGEATNSVFGFLPGDTTWGEARDNIEKVDQALAQMVESGNAEQAADAMAEIVKQAQAQGISVAEATKWFKDYNEALKNSQTADDAAAAQERYADALGSSARVSKLTRTQIEGLNAAMEEQTSAALGAFDAVTQYARALDAAQKQARKSQAGIDASTEAGRKNRDALSQLAAAWNNQGNAIRNNMGKWQAARAEFIRVAQQMGATGAEARNLANKILEIPKQRQIDIKLYGSEQAASQIERIRRELSSIPRSIRTDYYVNQVNAINKRGQYAEGGFTGPGGKYEPRGVVHAGEVVIPQSLVKRDWGMLSSRYGHLPGFAGGGVVGGGSSGNGSLWGLSGEADAAAESLANLNSMSKKTLTQRERFLTHEQKLAEKAMDAAQERVDEEKAALRDLKDARKAFADEVSGNFMSSLFGDTDLVAAIRDGLLPSETLRNIKGTGDHGGITDEDVQKYLDSLSASQIAMLQAQANSGILGRDTRGANQFTDLLKQLRGLGLNGGAFRELAASGNIGQAQFYASMTPDQIAQFEQDYRDRNRAAQGAGRLAGDSEFGRSVRQQTRATEKAVAIQHEIRDQQRELNQLSKSIDKRLEQLNRIESAAPKETGKEVAGALNKAAADAARKAKG